MTAHADLYGDRNHKPVMLAPNFDSIDEALKAEPRWILWRLDWKGQRWAKVPYRVTGQHAKSNDPSTWSDFATVAAAYAKGGYDGIGFVLGDGWAGGDLDNARDPRTGELTNIAAELILDGCSTYAEASPSGTGVKWIGRGQWHAKENRKQLPGGSEVEVYSTGRYFTVTGRRVSAHPVRDTQASLNRLAATLFAEPEKSTRPVPPPPKQPADLDDVALVSRATTANDGGKFRQLWQGDTSACNGDESRADLSLCCKLAFWTGKDVDRMDRLFRQSGLMRPKWDEKRGKQTYGERTIARAVAMTTDTYEPHRNERRKLTEATEPPLPNRDEERFRPFPVESLPQPIRRFVVDGAKAIGCDLSYLALPLLTALAAAIGNTRRLELKRGWSAPPILWTAIVGESGTTKTPAFKLVMRPVRERQRKAFERHADEMKQYEADLARWEKDYTAWKRDKNAGDPPTKPDMPHAERFIVADTTVEALAPILMANPRGLLLARDELAGWFGSFDRYSGKGKAGADASNWLSMFNAESITVDRKTGIPRTIHVPQAAVCVTGGIQPGILQRALSPEHRESGLAARLLLSCPPRKVKKWTEADIDPKAEAELAELFGRLLELQPVECEGEPQPVLVRLNPAAKAIWTAYYDAHAEEQADLSGDLSAAWSKLEESAARLALVIHLVRWAAKDSTLADACVLDAESMNAGIALVKWFKHEARRVYGMLSESDAARDERRLVEWIERKGGSVTARDVQQGCRWLKEPGAAEAALEGLVKARRGSWRVPETTEKGGRPARAFALSTASTVYETPKAAPVNGGSVDVDTVDAGETKPVGESGLFPFGFNNLDDPDGERLFPVPRGLPD